MALTDRVIQTKGKPAAKAFKLTDSHGLYLLVKPTGGRYWSSIIVKTASIEPWR